MKDNKTPGRWMVDIALMAIVFFVIQVVVNAAVTLVYGFLNNVGAMEVAAEMANGKQGQLVAVTSVMSSLLTIMVYPRLKWTPIDRSYLRSRPWATLFWCATLALGTILPFEWVYEQLQIQMSDSKQALFESVMREPWGYVALGILAPVAEEFVFRGGILRALLCMMEGPVWIARAHIPALGIDKVKNGSPRMAPWRAIVLSALIFGAVHMNAAQGIHGFIMGLLLGWLYYRTGSMMPGIIVHWVNNSVAYLMFALMPNMADGKLIDLFHGSERMMLMGVFFSLCLLVPSLFQIFLRTKK